MADATRRSLADDRTSLAFCLVLLGTILVLGSIFWGRSASGAPPYQFSSAVLFSIGVLVGLFRGLFSFQLICFVIIFFPALSPVYAWDLRGVQLFSLAARDLQSDKVLIDTALFVFAIGAVTYGFGVLLGTTPEEDERSSAPHRTMPLPATLLVAGMLVVSTFVTESGPTILTANYTEILKGGLTETPLVVFLSQSYGAYLALLFVFCRHNKSVFWTCLVIVALWLALHIRRVELFGTLLVLILWLRYRISTQVLSIAVAAFVASQIFVGDIRNTSIIDRLSSTGMSGVSTHLEEKADLPGGASNVFLSGLHLIKQRENAQLAIDQHFTMGEWVRSVIPNGIWTSFGYEPVQSEHDLVYGALGLVYVGGMPLLAAFFLNGGIALVVLFGLFHGWIAQIVDRIFDRDLRFNLQRGGTFALFLSSVYLVYFFRLQWYNPETPIRALVFSLVAYSLFRGAMRLRSRG